MKKEKRVKKYKKVINESVSPFPAFSAPLE
jgi:hypothetical protein